MLAMDKGILETQKMVVVVLVELRVELFLASVQISPPGERRTHQIQNGNLHHTLVEISRSVLDDFDGHHFLGLQILTLDDLTKGTLAKNIQNEVSIPAL